MNVVFSDKATEIKENRKSVHLLTDELHVYSVLLSDYENNFNNLTSLLSEDEQMRAENFKFSKDQHLFVSARAILRCFLSLYVNTSPKNIKITYGLWGKPYLEGDQSLYFNVSHSKDYALYAFTRHYEVGIDLEYVEENFYSTDTHLCMFSPEEERYLEDVDIKDKNRAFYNLWVGKEAILKALGKGWMENGKTEDFLNIDFSNPASLKNFDNLKISYPFYFECIPGYMSSVFVKGPPLLLRYFSFEQQGFQRKLRDFLFDSVKKTGCWANNLLIN